TIGGMGQQCEDRDDRNQPLLLWDGLAQRMAKDVERGFKVAERSTIPQLTDWIYWYGATFGGDALNRVVAQLDRSRGEPLRRRLAGIELAMNSGAKVPMPAAWPSVAGRLYGAEDKRVQRQAERLAAVFGDASMFSRLREALGTAGADVDSRQHAFAVLSRAQDRATLPVFIGLLDDAAFRLQTINLLARFDAPEIPEALFSRFERFPPAERAAAVNTLTSRAD